MSRILSQTNIEAVELFIQENKPEKFLPSNSECDRSEAIYGWNTISRPDTPVTSYYQYSSDGCGMTSYGFYKSRAGNIYIITAFMNKIRYYCDVDSNWGFLRPWKSEDEDDDDDKYYTDVMAQDAK